MSFNANNKAIETKLVEKMGIEQPAGHPFCNTHTALAMTASGFYIMELSSIVAPCLVVITTAQLHSTACRRFTMVRISDNGPGWK